MTDSDALLFARHIEDRQRGIETDLAECGYDAVLIHSGSQQVRFLDDYPHVFRANPHFITWAPLPWTPDCAVLVRPGRRPRLWYCQPDDFWHAAPADPEAWWADVLDIRPVADAEAFTDDIGAPGSLAVIGDAPVLARAFPNADHNPRRLLRRLDEARTFKTAWERQQIATANRVAVGGHRAAERAFREGASELDIHLAFLAAVRLPEARLPYSSIVGLDEHAAVLHYQYKDAVMRRTPRTLLIDAGADQYGYASDITRTWTRDTGDFAALIKAVDNLQSRLVEAARPGTGFPALHRRAHGLVAAVLEQSGLVRMAPDDMVDSGITGYFFPHGLGHFLGIQVHDVAGHRAPDGASLPPPEDHPALRLTRDLEAGNVVTIEPGVYFIPSLLEKLRASGRGEAVDWKAVEAMMPFGGVRVEDDVLITESEPVNFTREAFAEAG